MELLGPIFTKNTRCIAQIKNQDEFMLLLYYHSGVFLQDFSYIMTQIKRLSNQKSVASKKRYSNMFVIKEL